MNLLDLLIAPAYAQTAAQPQGMGGFGLLQGANLTRLCRELKVLLTQRAGEMAGRGQL